MSKNTHKQLAGRSKTLRCASIKDGKEVERMEACSPQLKDEQRLGRVLTAYLMANDEDWSDESKRVELLARRNACSAASMTLEMGDGATRALACYKHVMRRRRKQQ